MASDAAIFRAAHPVARSTRTLDTLARRKIRFNFHAVLPRMGPQANAKSFQLRLVLCVMTRTIAMRKRPAMGRVLRVQLVFPNPITTQNVAV